jgi:hypothetical protein
MNISFKHFAKEYWGLFAAVIIFPTILFAVFFVLYQVEDIDKSIFVAFITCIISYVGTIGLSIFIFHNSWLKGKEEEYRHRPRLSINCHYDRFKLSNGDGHQCFFSYERLKKDLKGKLNEIQIYDGNRGHMDETLYGYLGIILKNHSSNLIFTKVFKKIYVINKEDKEADIKVQKGRIWFSLEDNPSTLAFNATAMYFLGIEKALVDTALPIRREIYTLLSVEDDFSKEHHYLIYIQYNNGTIMFNCEKEINNKELDILYKKPKVLLNLFDR